jgi:hypothetical protein
MAAAAAAATVQRFHAEPQGTLKIATCLYVIVPSPQPEVLASLLDLASASLLAAAAVLAILLPPASNEQKLQIKS